MLKTTPLPKFSKANPQYTEHQLRWMVKNGEHNGMFQNKAAVKKNGRIHVVEPNFWNWIVEGDE